MWNNRVGLSFKISPAQAAALEAADLDTERKITGMAKWEILFTDGSHSTMLSNDCRDRATALLGAIERFGAKVLNVK